MMAATGASYPDRPEIEIKDLRKGRLSDIKTWMRRQRILYDDYGNGVTVGGDSFVGVNVSVGVSVKVRVGVGVNVGVKVDVLVKVGVGVKVGVNVGVLVKVGVNVGVFVFG
jgi:hypothetical protein